MVRTTVFKQFCKKNDKLEERIECLKKDLENDPENISKLKELAVIYHFVKEDEKAIEIYILQFSVWCRFRQRLWMLY